MLLQTVIDFDWHKNAPGTITGPHQENDIYLEYTRIRKKREYATLY